MSKRVTMQRNGDARVPRSLRTTRAAENDFLYGYLTGYPSLTCYYAQSRDYTSTTWALYFAMQLHINLCHPYSKAPFTNLDKIT